MDKIILQIDFKGCVRELRTLGIFVFTSAIVGCSTSMIYNYYVNRFEYECRPYFGSETRIATIIGGAYGLCFYMCYYGIRNT